MMNENAEFRLAAGRLVDALKRPENADILDQFVKYDASREDGWSNFDIETRPEYRAEMGLSIKITVLNHEQIVRWRAINDECNIAGSGASDSITWLIAQGMLGRLDVYKNKGGE